MGCGLMKTQCYKHATEVLRKESNENFLEFEAVLFDLTDSNVLQASDYSDS